MCTPLAQVPKKLAVFSTRCTYSTATTATVKVGLGAPPIGQRPQAERDGGRRRGRVRALLQHQHSRSPWILRAHRAQLQSAHHRQIDLRPAVEGRTHHRPRSVAGAGERRSAGSLGTSLKVPRAATWLAASAGDHGQTVFPRCRSEGSVHWQFAGARVTGDVRGLAASLGRGTPRKDHRHGRRQNTAQPAYAPPAPDFTPVVSVANTRTLTRANVRPTRRCHTYRCHSLPAPWHR